MKPDLRRRLLGRLVRVTSARLGGTMVGLVRAVGPAGPTIQRPSLSWSRSVSSRCRGERLRVSWEEVDGVLERRRAWPAQVVPLERFLRS